MEFSDKEIIDAFKDLGAMKFQMSSQETSIKELYGRMTVQERVADRADEGMKGIKCSVDEMKLSVNTALSSFSEQLKKLQLEPGENWKLSKKTILTSVISGFVVLGLGVAVWAYSQQQYQDKITGIQMQYEAEISNLKNAIEMYQNAAEQQIK